MRHKLSLVLTLVAWLLATGSHWDLVQTFGWSRMIATYSETMSFTSAVKKTFSAGATCGVCEVVAAAKQADPASAPGAPGKSFEKIHLIFSPATTLVLAAPPVSPWSLSDHLTPSSDPATPPVPPPRDLA